jgi:N-dimethylarginine dimethylaminohydrolase
MPDMALINTTVLMSGVDYFDDSQAINPFMDASGINRETAAAEHNKIRHALERAGVTVIKVTPPADCQDGVYTANWALVRGDKAVMSRLPGARKAEEPYAEQILRSQGKEVIHIPGELRHSGQGDALPCGNYLFCGSGYRSNVEAQEFVAEQLGYDRVQLRTVPLQDANGQPVINSYSGWPDSFYYDLDLALSILRAPSEGQKGLIAWCPDAFMPESQKTLRSFTEVDKIEVSELEARQAFACNLVSTGETVIMNAAAIEFAKAIEAHGLKTIRLNNPELGKGGGSIRCTTLTLSTK